MRFLVDEDLPRSLALRLREAGFDAADARDVGLRGRSDEDVLRFAVRESRTVVTSDVGFGNILRFDLGSHAGIIVARFPNEVSARVLTAGLVAAILLLSQADVEGNVITITSSRIRIRRSPDS